MAFVSAVLDGLTLKPSEFAFDYWGGATYPTDTDPIESFVKKKGTDLAKVVRDWNPALHARRRICVNSEGEVWMEITAISQITNSGWLHDLYTIKFTANNLLGNVVGEGSYGIYTKATKGANTQLFEAYLFWGVDEENEKLVFVPLYQYCGDYHLPAVLEVRNLIGNRNIVTSASQTAMYNLFYGSIHEWDNDPYSIGGNSNIGGGNGELDITSDVISVPTIPTFNIGNTGFVKAYNPSVGELGTLASYLWDDNFLNTLVKLKQDPMDIIVGLTAFPFAIPSTNTADVQAGNVDTHISMHVPDSNYVEVDCGELKINSFYDSYLDFDPYTKANIYLPYVGNQSLSMDEIMGKTLGVKYRVDILTGAFICYVTADSSIIATFTGMCGVNIPLSAVSYTDTVNAMVGLAMGAVTGGITMGGMLQAGYNVMAAKPNFQKSGSITGNAGVLGVQTPYITFTVPRIALPKDSMKINGYPLHMTAKIDDLSGYTEIEDIKLENISCTEEEKQRIIDILKGGVFI